MPEPDLINTPYELSLSDEQLLVLGKIAAMWGHIDESVNVILSQLLGLSKELHAKLISNQMIGKKCQYLKIAMQSCQDDTLKNELAAASEKLTSVIPRRNNAMHGAWGNFVLDPSFQKLRSGTFNPMKPGARFYASQLNKLHNDVADTLSKLSRVVMILVDGDPYLDDLNQNKLYFYHRAPDERAVGVVFQRGDRVVHVPSNV